MLIVYGMPKAHGRYAGIGTYRFLTGNDAVSYRDHLTRLDINSRCARFSGAMTDAAIVGYVGRVAWERIDMMGYFVDGILRGVAEVHYDRSSAPVKAEIALSIENDFQNRRVGSKLMSIIVVILHEKSINNADVICDTENKRMYYLAQKHGADEFQEDGTMFMTIFVPHAIECTSISEIKGLYVNNQAANAEEIREAA